MTKSIRDVFAEVELWGDNVANELAKRGVKGRKGSCEQCPMAVYVLKETGVGEIEVEQFGTWYGDLFNMEYVDHPDNVIEFIEEFDEGKYPQLDVEDQDKEEIPEEDDNQIPLF